MRHRLLTTTFALCTSLLAQTCDPPPVSPLRTWDPWQGSFFFGPYNNTGETVNTYFDLDVQTQVTINSMLMTTYDQGAQSGPANQVGNVMEVRIYLTPNTRTGNEYSPTNWTLAARAELTVVAWPGDSPVQNFKDPAGNPAPFVIAPGQHGVCIEMIPTSWNGTALLPQTNVPLVNPGSVHTIGYAPNPGTPFSAPFLTMSNDGILGQGWQQVDASGNLVPDSPFLNTSGSVNLQIDYSFGTPGGSLKTQYGSGCYSSPRMVYERIRDSGQPVDLASTEWTLAFQPDGTGGHYTITPGGPAYDGATAIAQGVDLLPMTPTTSSSASWDDGSLVHALSTTTFPSGLPFPGGNCTEITINSNGKLYLGTMLDPSFQANGPSLGGLLPFQVLLPQLAPFHVDLDPTLNGDFRLEDPSPNGGVRVTWHGIPTYTVAAFFLCDVQIELLPNGTVYFVYGPRLHNQTQSNDAIIGFSAGNGQQLSEAIDWSAITSYVTGTGAVAPVLDLSAPPVIGTTVEAIITELGPSPAQPLGGFVALALQSLPSGLSLGGYGLPGCEAHVDLGLVLFSVLLTNTNNTDLRWSWNVPPSANGVEVYLQGGVFGPTPHNAIGMTLTNAVCASIGQ